MNPTIKEFLEKYPQATLLSFGWAIFWRLYAVIIGVCAVLAFVGEIFG